MKIVRPRCKSMPCVEIQCGCRAGRQGQTEKRRASLGVPEQPVIWMQGDHRCSLQCAHQISGAADMVEVGVSDPDLADSPIALFGLGCNQMPIPGRIDNCRLASIGIGNQIGIGSDRTKDERDDFEHFTLSAAQ